MDFLTFFGLKEDPFKLTPDPAYFYPSSSHNEGLLLMDYSIDQKEGFLLVIGDPGTGKTTLLKVFMEKWKSRAEIAIVLTPRLSPEEFLLSVAEDLKITLNNKNKNEVIRALRDFMMKQSAENKRVIIIVDEAQNMPDETLEELRLLSNLETNKDKLIQIILLGQPELELKLQSETLRQLNQRIVTRVHLQHFNLEETRDYINFRLIKAGKENLKVHSKAVKSVLSYTSGVPRLINMLISRALMAAFLEESNTVLHKHIQHAIKSLNHTDMKLKEYNYMVPVISAAAALFAVSIAAFLYISKSDHFEKTAAIDTNHLATNKTAVVAIDTAPEKNNYDQPESITVTEDTAVNEDKPSAEEVSASAATNNSQPSQESTKAALSDPPVQDSISTDVSAQTLSDTKVYTYTVPFKLISINVDVALIRDKPSMEANKVGWAQNGNQYVVLNESTDANNVKWYMVSHQGGKHWISAEVADEINLNPY